MLNSVTEHGDPPTNSPKPAPRQADTGSKSTEPAQATVVMTVSSSLPPVTSLSNPSDSQSQPHSLATSEHESAAPVAEHNRLKISFLASLFLTKLWATVASLYTAMSKLGALT